MTSVKIEWAITDTLKELQLLLKQIRLFIENEDNRRGGNRREGSS